MADALTPLEIALNLLERLEYRYQIIGNREGDMCPVCYKFRPQERYTKHHTRSNYGHALDCWLGKDLLRLRTALHPDRAVALRMTRRQALTVRTILSKEARDRRRRQAKSSFVPAPGRYDANLSIASVVEDVLQQLEVQSIIKEKYEND